MPDYSRIASLVQNSVWFIEPRRGSQIAEAFLNRVEAGAASPSRFLTEAELEQNRTRAAVRRVPMGGTDTGGRMKEIAIIPLIGAILPRGDAMDDMSGGGAVSLVRFQREFEAVAADEKVGAIILEIDSPGGQVDLVPETAAMIARWRKKGRPIVAVSNTMAASAAYWIASAADEIVVTPSGMVGSIGVFQLHQNMEGYAAAMGIVPTYIFEGPRKVEGNPFEPMGDEARAAFQAEVRSAYEQFTADVAAYRGADVEAVRADPESGVKKHFGGGRAYSAGQLQSLGLIGRGGMADRVDTLQATMTRLMGGAPTSTRKANAKARLALS